MKVGINFVHFASMKVSKRKPRVHIMLKKAVFPSNHPNGEASHVNLTLDGCTYPSQKLVQFNLSKKTNNVNKTHQLKLGKGADIW